MSKKPKIKDEFPVTMGQLREKFCNGIFDIVTTLRIAADYKMGFTCRWRVEPEITEAERFEIVWADGDRRSEMRIRCRRGYGFDGQFFAIPLRGNTPTVMFTGFTREACESAYKVFTHECGSISRGAELKWFKTRFK